MMMSFFNKIIFAWILIFFFTSHLKAGQAEIQAQEIGVMQGSATAVSAFCPDYQVNQISIDRAAKSSRVLFSSELMGKFRAQYSRGIQEGIQRIVNRVALMPAKDDICGALFVEFGPSEMNVVTTKISQMNVSTEKTEEISPDFTRLPIIVAPSELAKENRTFNNNIIETSARCSFIKSRHYSCLIGHDAMMEFQDIKPVHQKIYIKDVCNGLKKMSQQQCKFVVRFQYEKFAYNKLNGDPGGIAVISPAYGVGYIFSVLTKKRR